MFGTGQHEAHAGGDRAEAADDEPFRAEGVENGVFVEVLGACRMVVVGVGADLDGRVPHERPQEDHPRLTGDRVNDGRIRSVRQNRHLR